MKRFIAYFVSGVRTGSFLLTLALLLLGQLFPQLVHHPKVSVENILALFMMSGLMGMLSWIFGDMTVCPTDLGNLTFLVDDCTDKDLSNSRLD